MICVSFAPQGATLNCKNFVSLLLAEKEFNTCLR